MFARVRLITSDQARRAGRARGGAGPAGHRAVRVQGRRRQGGAREGRDRPAPRRQGRDRRPASTRTTSSSPPASSSCATASPVRVAGSGRQRRGRDRRRRRAMRPRRHRIAGGRDAGQRRSAAAPRCLTASARELSHDPARDLHQAAGLRDGAVARHPAGRPHLLPAPVGARVPAHRRAGRQRRDTTYRGASAEVVESQVTKILEDSLSGIEGVEMMTSQSRSERSQINVRFKLSRNPDSAAADVRDKVSRVRGRCRTRSTSRSSPRSRPIRSRSSTSRCEAGSLTPLRGLRLRRPLHQAAPVRAAGRGRRAHLRRAPGVDAHQPRPHAARRLPAHRAGRRGRDPPAERGDPGRPHRVDVARVHRASPRPTCRRPSSSTSIIVANVGGYPVRIRDVGTVADRRARRARRSRATTASRRSTSA